LALNINWTSKSIDALPHAKRFHFFRTSFPIEYDEEEEDEDAKGDSTDRPPTIAAIRVLEEDDVLEEP
jgi:hypothetical protein